MKNYNKIRGFVYMVLLCTLALPQVARAQHPNLVLCHRYSGNANDGSSYAHSPAVNGPALVNDRFLNANSAYYFAPVPGSNDDNIQIADHSSLDLSTCYTIMAWVNPDPGYGRHFNSHIDIVSKWGNGTAAYLFGLDTNGYVISWTCNSGVNGYSRGNTVLTPNTWTHIAVTYDGKRMKFYINGVLDAVTNHSIVPQNSGFPLRIGHEGQVAPANDNTGFTGVIDEVRIFNITLAQSQVSTVMNLASCPAANSLPTASFTVSDTLVCAGSQKAVIVPGNGITSYIIDWGDGIMTAAKDTHTYNQPGNYTIIMHLDTSGLCSFDTAIRKIRVEACCELDVDITRRGCDTFSFDLVLGPLMTYAGSYWTLDGNPWPYNGGDTTLPPGSHTLCVYVLAHLDDSIGTKNCCMSKCFNISIPVPVQQILDTTYCQLDSFFRFDGNAYSQCASYLLTSGAGFAYNSKDSGKKVHKLTGGMYHFHCYDSNGCLVKLINLQVNMRLTTNTSCYQRYVICNSPPVDPNLVLPVPPNCPDCYVPNPAIRYGITAPETISYNPNTATTRYRKYIIDSTNCKRCEFIFDVVDSACNFVPDFNWTTPMPPYNYNFSVTSPSPTPPPLPFGIICPGSNVNWTITNLGTGVVVGTKSQLPPGGLSYNFTFPGPGTYRVRLEICACVCSTSCCKTVEYDFVVGDPPVLFSVPKKKETPAPGNGTQNEGSIRQPAGDGNGATFSIIPNPASSVFRIQPAGYTGETFQSVEILSAEGARVQYHTNIAVKHEYNLTSSPRGTYMVRVKANDNYYSMKLILQ